MPATSHIYMERELQAFSAAIFLGTFDRKVDAHAYRLAINIDFNLILTLVFLPSFTNHFKLNIDFLFLGPLDEFAFKIGIKVFKIVNINMDIYDPPDDNFTGKIVAFINIKRTNKGLEGIATH